MRSLMRLQNMTEQPKAEEEEIGINFTSSVKPGKGSGSFVFHSVRGSIEELRIYLAWQNPNKLNVQKYKCQKVNARDELNHFFAIKS